MTPPRPRYADLLARLDRARASGLALGLDNTRAVLAALHDPQRAPIVVHIAGTNGKGSTAAMTEAILRAAGMSTGLYTSPHLCRFTERIRVDGREVDGDDLAALADPIAAVGVPLTYFEFATVLAFQMFARAGVDVAVIETGLGGRLDATTTCAPVATAITSIAMDHAELLGPTLAHIAREKAGIAKPGIPLFLARVDAEADAEIATIAGRVGAPLRRFGVDFAAPVTAPALGGAHQRTNAAIAVALAGAAAEAAGRPLTDAHVAVGLGGVVWPGRLEWIRPNILLDCAHNPEGARALGAELDRGAAWPRALVFSAVTGKAADQMLAALAPRFDAIFLTRSSNDRSLTTDSLAALVPAGGPPVLSCADPADAMAAAAAWLAARGAPVPHPNDAAGTTRAGADGPAGGLIVAAGSSFLVGDVRAAVLGEARDPLPTSDPVSRPSR